MLGNQDGLTPERTANRPDATLQLCPHPLPGHDALEGWVSLLPPLRELVMSKRVDAQQSAVP